MSKVTKKIKTESGAVTTASAQPSSNSHDIKDSEAYPKKRGTDLYFVDDNMKYWVSSYILSESSVVFKAMIDSNSYDTFLGDIMGDNNGFAQIFLNSFHSNDCKIDKMHVGWLLRLYFKYDMGVQLKKCYDIIISGYMDHILAKTITQNNELRKYNKYVLKYYLDTPSENDINNLPSKILRWVLMVGSKFNEYKKNHCASLNEFLKNV